MLYFVKNKVWSLYQIRSLYKQCRIDTCPTEVATLSKAAPTGASRELPNHLCLRAAAADSLLLGWYCIRLVSSSHALPPSMLSIWKASWESLPALRSAKPRQALMSHLRDSNLRLKVCSWLSLQQQQWISRPFTFQGLGPRAKVAAHRSGNYLDDTHFSAL